MKNLLQVFRNEVHSKHSVYFPKSQRIADELDVTVKNPLKCLRQTNQAKTSSDTVEEFLKKFTSIPFLNHVLQEKETRFTDLYKRITFGLMLVPSKVHNLKNMDGLFTFFSDSIPSPYSINAEIKQWCMKWSKIDDTPGTLISTIKEIDGVFY